jgi:hypothetical protein
MMYICAYVGSPPLEVEAAPRQKASHYLHMGQQPSKQNKKKKL